MRNSFSKFILLACVTCDVVFILLSILVRQVWRFFADKISNVKTFLLRCIYQCHVVYIGVMFVYINVMHVVYINVMFVYTNVILYTSMLYERRIHQFCTL